MWLSFSLPKFIGYSIYAEWGNYPLEGKLLDWEVEVADTNIWVAGKLHIVISNEKYYEKQRIAERELNKP